LTIFSKFYEENEMRRILLSIVLILTLFNNGYSLPLEQEDHSPSFKTSSKHPNLVLAKDIVASVAPIVFAVLSFYCSRKKAVDGIFLDSPTIAFSVLDIIKNIHNWKNERQYQENLRKNPNFVPPVPSYSTLHTLCDVGSVITKIAFALRLLIWNEKLELYPWKNIREILLPVGITTIAVILPAINQGVKGYKYWRNFHPFNTKTNNSVKKRK
jgi:hypothetical protein